jgi:hypothetical protein
MKLIEGKLQQKIDLKDIVLGVKIHQIKKNSLAL